MKKNVLILEDEKVQSKKIEMLINSVSEGICSYPVNTYSEAMKILDVTPISFFCIDIDLGDDSEKKDGLDFARYIRSKSEYEFTPIIYITSVSSRLEEALSTTHCYAYIKKPYSDEEIKETAKKCSVCLQLSR
ncbi:MAG: response regulator [Eubacterium sp.]|nr:response regulator [Eubacterium sp.]